LTHPACIKCMIYIYMVSNDVQVVTNNNSSNTCKGMFLSFSFDANESDKHDFDSLDANELVKHNFNHSIL